MSEVIATYNTERGDMSERQQVADDLSRIVSEFNAKYEELRIDQRAHREGLLIGIHHDPYGSSADGVAHYHLEAVVSTESEMILPTRGHLQTNTDR